MRHLKQKAGGEWRHRYTKLLPGYVFVESNNIECLYKILIRTPGFKKVLGTVGDDVAFNFYALTPSEVNWLMAICGRQKQSDKIYPIIELSQVGFDENDKVVILSGPLKGREAMVKEINLHKRCADIEVSFMNRTIMLRVGIEIDSKPESAFCRPRWSLMRLPAAALRNKTAAK